MLLGRATSTDDREGEVVAEVDASAIREREVVAALATLTGEIAQVPPMASAKKVDGQRLHKLHRQGQVIERAPSLVRVDRLALLSFTRVPWRTPKSRWTAGRERTSGRWPGISARRSASADT